ncbi:hypothetical protein A2U01_0061154, partial [Trifolium medium]|nr:hypothetical protein [Trifolium medium]
RAFEIVCDGLDVEPSLGVFFYFYQVKGLEPHKWVSISAQANRGLYVPFASNFKNFKDGYFRVHHGVGADELMFDSNGEPLFPFYWTSQPVALKGTDPDAL